MHSCLRFVRIFGGFRPGFTLPISLPIWTWSTVKFDLSNGNTTSHMAVGCCPIITDVLLSFPHAQGEFKPTIACSLSKICNIPMIICALHVSQRAILDIFEQVNTRAWCRASPGLVNTDNGRRRQPLHAFFVNWAMRVN